MSDPAELQSAKDAEFGGATRSAALDEQSAIPLVPREGLWEGQIAIVGQTLIDGAVNGSLRGPGELVLGSGARVEGLIECDVVESQGQIVGPVVARRRARLGAGARFEGDLDAPSLEVDDDVIWNGVARVGR